MQILTKQRNYKSTNIEVFLNPRKLVPTKMNVSKAFGWNSGMQLIIVIHVNVMTMAKEREI